MFKCSKCNIDKPTSEHLIGTGYAIDLNNNKICYNCVAKIDLDDMDKTGKITLYLNYTGSKFELCPENYTLTNWPGTLKIKIGSIKKSKHNFAGYRLDYYFKHNGKFWHGYTIGSNTQIAHCKRLK